MYSRQELNISGRRSTGFYGEEIAGESNRETSEDTRFEWDAVRIFEVDPVWAREQEEKEFKRTGRRIKIDPYRVGIARCTIMEGDRDKYRVFYCKTIEQVLRVVQSHLPIFHREIEEQLRFYNAPTGGLGHESRARTVE
jgi:hypothetical protein